MSKNEDPSYHLFQLILQNTKDRKKIVPKEDKDKLALFIRNMPSTDHIMFGNIIRYYNMTFKGDRYVTFQVCDDGTYLFNINDMPDQLLNILKTFSEFYEIDKNT